MTDKEIFKAELDRLKQETSIGLSEWENGVEHGRMEIINALYRTLDSMQEEPVSEGLKKAANTYMNEEIDNGADYVGQDGDYYFYATGLEYAFKAGANWQKEQDKQWLAEEHKHIFAKGRDSMKQQMMKEAIERNVQIDAGGYPYIDVNVELYDYDKDIPLAKEGDKVKLLIIKED